MVVESIENNMQDSRFRLAGGLVQTLTGKMGAGGNNAPMCLSPFQGQ